MFILPSQTSGFSIIISHFCSCFSKQSINFVSLNPMTFPRGSTLIFLSGICMRFLPHSQISGTFETRRGNTVADLRSEQENEQSAFPPHCVISDMSRQIFRRNMARQVPCASYRTCSWPRSEKLLSSECSLHASKI